MYDGSIILLGLLLHLSSMTNQLSKVVTLILVLLEIMA